MTSRSKCIVESFCLVVAVTGCALSTRNSEIRPQPVQFVHPDEYRRGEEFMVLADRRVFAVMAFLNAVGYDEEIEGKQMHPVRVKVRKKVADNLGKSPDKLQTWQQYYKTRGLATFHYQDFAASLSADYPFGRTRPDSELGYPHTAGILKDFPAVLNDFWVTTELDKVWQQVKDDYIAEISKYDMEKMGWQMSFLWEYLRMKRQDAFIIVNVPDPLDRYYHAIGAHYEKYYYCVESPGSHAYDLNINEYLHSIANRIVKANYRKYRDKLDKYYNAGRTGPMSKTYQEPVTFASDCLVRAMDDRLHALLANDATTTKKSASRVADLSAQGLTLTQPFYALLSDYEKTNRNLEEFFPLMLDKLPEYRR